MTYIAIVGFIAILGSLAAAMFFMLKGGDKDKQDEKPLDNKEVKAKASKMAKALAFRVGFSVLLFICVLMAWRLGYIHPTGIPARR